MYAASKLLLNEIRFDCLRVTLQGDSIILKFYEHSLLITYKLFRTIKIASQGLWLTSRNM
jgi:hypothetical protein